MAYEKIFSVPSHIAVQGHTGCAGCSESLVVQTVYTIFDELGVKPEDVIGIMGAGCSGMAWCSSLKGSTAGNTRANWNIVAGPHGRGASISTGMKRAHPEKFVLSFQGDGDLAGIGLHDTIHAANRGEGFTVLFQNNQVYGTTGGQMAPTTMIGQKTTTSPNGRIPSAGYPLHICEMLAPLPGVKYCARVMFTDQKNLLFARKCIKKALECQLNDNGYAIVETLSACPSNWHMTVEQSYDHIASVVSKEFPIGEFKTY